MLMQTKRFRFNNKYIYGSAAFIAGFGGLMTLFVNLAPLHVPSANIATIPETPKSQEITAETEEASQTDTQNQPTNTAPNNNVPASEPTVTGNGTVVTPTTPTETPAPTTTEPTAPVTTPTTPVVDEPETPVLPQIPIVGPILDPLLP